MAVIQDFVSRHDVLRDVIDRTTAFASHFATSNTTRKVCSRDSTLNTIYGKRTGDIWSEGTKKVTTSEMGDAILKELQTLAG